MERKDFIKCDQCGFLHHVNYLDAKPEHLAGPGGWLVRLFPKRRLAALRLAADTGDDFERLECEHCYGPGYVSLPLRYEGFGHAASIARAMRLVVSYDVRTAGLTAFSKTAVVEVAAVHPGQTLLDAARERLIVSYPIHRLFDRHNLHNVRIARVFGEGQV
jgi:hypothetical protein